MTAEEIRERPQFPAPGLAGACRKTAGSVQERKGEQAALRSAQDLRECLLNPEDCDAK